MKTRLACCTFACLVAITLLADTSKANSFPPGKKLDFSGGSGGTFSYTPSLGNTASITNAPIGKVIGYPSFSSLGITDGTLDITTGACIRGCVATTRSTGITTSVSQFAPGGSLELFGEIPSLGINTETELIGGNFVMYTDPSGIKHPATGMSLTTNPGTNSGLNAYLNVSTIDPALLLYYNMNPMFTGGSGELSDLLLELTFTSSSWNGSIKTSDLLVDPALPEPPGLLLFGSSMLFAAYLLRKKLTARSNQLNA
jgi:hypothetical protein